MSNVINILAKLPNNIKERILEPSSLRINNDVPGLFIPKEYVIILNETLKELKYKISEEVSTEKNNNQIKIVDSFISIIENNII